MNRAPLLVALTILLGCESTPPEAPQPPLPTTWSTVEVPPAPADIPFMLGERLYDWNCFPCHGAEGRGDGPNAQRQGLFPRDFTRGLFKLKTSAPGEMPFDDDLYRTIAAGIPTAGMPRIDALEPPDRWALVQYVKSLSFRDRTDGRRENHFETKPPETRWVAPKAPSTNRARGKQLFERGAQCAACHGAGGRGDGPAAAELRDAWEHPAPLPDLTRGALGLKAGRETPDVYRVLTLGMAGTPMPSFASLPEQDRWDLAAFVTGLFRPVSAGERIYLQAGCAACHTVGRGKLVGPDLMDVRSRHDAAWLRRWLSDPPAMLSQDSATRAFFKDFAVQMPKPALTDDEIGALVEYLQTLIPSRP